MIWSSVASARGSPDVASTYWMARNTRGIRHSWYSTGTIDLSASRAVLSSPWTSREVIALGDSTMSMHAQVSRASSTD